MQKQSSRSKNGKRCSIFALYVILFFLLTACNATPLPSTNRVFIKVAGSTSMKPLLVQLTKAYSANHPNTSFDIQGGGSQLGRQLVEAGQIGMGMVSGPISNPSDNVRLYPIARDSIAVILNPENSLIELSLHELRGIFSGRILNWQEVDGLAAAIQVVSREDGSGTRAVFEASVMDDHPVTPAAVVLPSSQAVADFVAQNPNAIGYVSTAFVDGRVYPIVVDGVTPTPENLKSGDYPLTRDLMLMTPVQNTPEINQFLEFVLSPAGQEIVAQHWGTIR